MSVNSDSSDVIRHLSQLNFSVFTRELNKLGGRNRPRDRRNKIRKLWLKIVRNTLRARDIQTVITFLYASKARTAANKNVMTSSIEKWRSRCQQRIDIRGQWKSLMPGAVRLCHKRRMDDVKAKVHALRAIHASNFIMQLPRFNEIKYGALFKQMNDDQVDKKPPSIVEETSVKQTSVEEEESEAETSESASCENSYFEEEEKSEYGDAASVSSSSKKESPPPSPKLVKERSVVLNQAPNTDFKIHPVMKNSLPQPVKDFVAKFDRMTLGIAFGILLVTIVITYITKSLIFWVNGTFDKYSQYQFNLTLPIYDPNYDVDIFINYSQILPSDPQHDLLKIVQEMRKELKDVKSKQTELIDQVLQLNKANN